MDQSSSSSGIFSGLGQWLKNRATTAGKDISEDVTISPEYEEFLAQERASRKVRIELIKRKELAELRKIRQADTNYKPNIDTRHNASHLGDKIAISIGPQSTMEKIASIEARMANNWGHSASNPIKAHTNDVLGKQRTAGQKTSEFATLPVHAKTNAGFFSSSQQEAIHMPMVMEGNKKVVYHYPSPLIEVATTFASAEYVASKSQLVALIQQKESAEFLLPCWEVWLEYLLSTGDQTNFENASVAFASKFGRSGPTWSSQWSKNEWLELGNAEPDSSSSSKKPIIWLCQAELQPQDVLTFARSLANGLNRATVVLNWTELQSIAPAAIDALCYVVHQIADQSWLVKSINHQQVMKIIQEELSTPHNSQLSRSWYLLKLSFLRLMNQMHEHAQACIDFCIAFDESAPSWKSPKSKFTVFDLPYLSEDGLVASVNSSHFESTLLTHLDDSQNREVFSSSTASSPNHFVLKGHLTGDISSILRKWEITPQTELLQIDCQHLIRIDPTAAAILLSWVRKQNRNDIIVEMLQLHRLIAIYLFSIGLSVKNKINLLKI